MTTLDFSRDAGAGSTAVPRAGGSPNANANANPYQISPYTLVRFNPVTGSGDAVEYRELTQLLDRLADVAEKRDRLADELHALLYSLVPNADKAFRNKVLLPASRDVVNRRPLRVATPELGDLVEHQLVRDWLALDEIAEDAAGRLDQAIDNALVAERAALQQILGDGRFQSAAALTSTSLVESAAKYAETPVAQHNKRQRKSEAKLLRYAERATNKTSPFSWFTAVAFGRWDSTGRTVNSLTATPTVNRASVLRLRDDALSVDDIRDNVVHALAPSLHRTDDGWAFDTLRDDPARRIRVHGAVRHDISLKATGLISAIVDTLTDGGPLTLRELAVTIGRRASAEPEQVLARLRPLARAGLLVAALPIDELAADPVAEFANELRAIDSVAAEDLAGQADELSRSIAAVGVSAGVQRARRIDELGGCFDAAFTSLGAEPIVASHVYEDVVADDAVGVSTARWHRVLADLRALAPALAPMNNTYIGQALVTVEVADRIAERGQVRYDEYVAMLPDIFATAATTVPAMLERIGDRAPDLDALLALRKPFVDAFKAGGDIDPDVVAAAAAAIPPRYAQNPISMACFLQPTAESAGAITEAVLNTVLGGYSQFTSRFLQHRHPAHLALVREHLRDTLPDDAVEFRPVHGFNANIHPALLPRQFAVPGLSTNDPYVTEAIDTHRCFLRYENGNLRMIGPDGRTITPMYMGFLVPYLLPYDLAGLYMLSPTSLIKPDLTGELEEHLPAEQKSVIRAYPQVRYGSVVIARRRWFVPGALTPRQQAGQSAAEHLLAVEKWRFENGIPARVYVSAAPDPNATETDAAKAEALAGRKPNFLDLRSPLHLRCLSTLVGEYATLRIAEATPDPTDRPADPHVGRATAEYLIELH